MMYTRRLTIVIGLFTTFCLWCDQCIPSSNYIPVVLVAGLNADEVDMKPLQKFIQQYLPGIYVKNVDIGLGKLTSFWNIYSQTNDFVETIYSDCNLRNGFNLVAWSQGGLVARYYIERHNMPQVYTYISLATPQRGYYGTPSSILGSQYTWLDKCDPYISDFFYLSFFQRYVSLAGYWHDPLQYEAYLKYCRFLPYLNNEKNHCHATLFKENMKKLTNMVLIRALCDTVIDPVESTHFGFYQEGSDETIETLFESEGFQNDTLGLKTLYDQGKLQFRETNGTHYETVTSEANFVQNILPFLKSPRMSDVVTGNS